jgi:hypothetical protein
VVELHASEMSFAQTIYHVFSRKVIA